MTPSIADRLKGINGLCEKIAHLAPVSEPVTPEDYDEMLERLDLLEAFSDDLAGHIASDLDDLDDYKSDWLSDWKERNARDADLYGMPNHRLDGNPR